ncbi:hypothetical protein ILYODFUR_017239 [Ilyodon furcidens]|uniref:Cytochrome c biogenesis B n=1 Tax=Ilyodon furcidens TaxID=33524 RepID=A0ABV0T0G2_9TELE
MLFVVPFLTVVINIYLLWSSRFTTNRSAPTELLHSKIRLLFLLVFTSQESPQQIICLHLTLSPGSSLTPTTFMSSFTPSINLLFGLPLGLLPGRSSLSILLPMDSLSLLFLIEIEMSNPSQSGLSGFISSISNMSWPSDILISDRIHPRHSQREPQHVHLCYLQLCLLSLPQCHHITMMHRSPSSCTPFFSFLLILLSHNTPDTFLHLFQPAWTCFFTSFPHSPLVRTKILHLLYLCSL